MAGKVNHDTGLQDAQQRFADEYLIDFNATAAYHRAGYKAKGQSAMAAASRLLTNQKVAAYLAKRKQMLLDNAQVSVERTLERLAHLALGDRRALFAQDGSFKAIHDLSELEASLIQGIEVVELYGAAGDNGKERVAIGHTKKVKLVNGLDAVKALGTHFGMFVKKVENTHRVEGLGGLLEEIDGAGTGPGPSSSRRT